MRRFESLISSQLWLMREGESITFTRLVETLPVGPQAANRVSQLICSYVSRRRPGCKWKFESFTTITHAGNVFAGAIVTLLKESQNGQ